MKPRAYLTCENSDCSELDKEVELSEKDAGASVFGCFCPKCHSPARLRLVHKSIEATSNEAFHAKVGGMAREFHLLKKLVTKGLAEPEDQARYEEILEQIGDLQCGGCGQKLVEHEH